MRIVRKHKLWSYIQAFLEDGTFPTKVHWKRVIVKAINNTEKNMWREKIASKCPGDLTVSKRTGTSYRIQLIFL
jgi:hypothetical protein